MAYHFFIMFVLISSTFGSPVHKNNQRGKDFYFSPKKVVDFTVHISEAGEEYNEKIKVDPNKRTELFQVPAHPGVDRSDTLHDFKQNLSMLRFPYGKICYLFPLAKEQSTPEKLMRDLEKAKQMVITETRQVDTTWIVNGELTDRAALNDELADFCAQYPIFHVKRALESLKVAGIQTEERAHRTRRQTTMDLHDGEPLCHWGMDLNTAYQKCPKPKWKLHEYHSCVRYVECDDRGTSHDTSCTTFHDYRFIVCYEFICDNSNTAQQNHQQYGSGSGEGSGEEAGDEGSGDVLERL